MFLEKKKSLSYSYFSVLKFSWMQNLFWWVVSCLSLAFSMKGNASHRGGEQKVDDFWEAAGGLTGKCGKRNIRWATRRWMESLRGQMESMYSSRTLCIVVLHHPQFFNNSFSWGQYEQQTGEKQAMESYVGPGGHWGHIVTLHISGLNARTGHNTLFLCVYVKLAQF